jgi:hypothetical protein
MVLCLCSAAGASIISASAHDDGSGAFVCTSTSWVKSTSTMYIDGNQYWYPGNVQSQYTTDTPEDPTVWVRNTVENDTDFAWTDFHIDITMSKPFTIDSASGPTNWTFQITPPVQQVDLSYLGKIDYYRASGSAVAIGGTGDFDYQLSFAGSISYNQQMIPTPEPGTVVLLAGGVVALRRRRRK